MTTFCTLVQILLIFLSIFNSRVNSYSFGNNTIGVIYGLHSVVPKANVTVEKDTIVSNTRPHNNVTNNKNFYGVHASNSEVDPPIIEKAATIDQTVETAADKSLEPIPRPNVISENPVTASEASLPDLGSEVHLHRSAQAEERYAPTRGPLECLSVLPYLRRTVEAACYSQWPQESYLPTLSCEVASGFKPIAGTYLERFLYKATYQVMDTSIADPSIPGDWNGWCAFQTSLMILKVESPDEISGLPVIEDDKMNKYTEMKDKAGTVGEASFIPVVAHGFNALVLEFGQDGLGARVAWMADYNCSSCASEVWHVEYWDGGEVARLFVNRARRVLMRFRNAFMSPATFVLSLLQEGARVQEIEVHGGAEWSDTVLLPVRLPRMRRLDLASNGLRELSELNFIRVPNLQHLDLSNNKFTKLPDGLKYLRSLKYLDLSNNPIVQSDFTTILCPLQGLKELNLSGAPLDSLAPLASGNTSCEWSTDNSSHAYGNAFPRLEVLDVSGCNVSSAESGLWATARRLRTLRLADNPLASVPASLPARLPALQELDLGGCQLRAPPSLRLAPAPRLRRLVLARNLLATPRGALAPFAAGAGAPERLHVDLSGNPLRGEWEADAFAALGEGASVNLSRTGLTALSPQMLRSLRPLAQVDLGRNTFDCAHCSILYMQEWLRNNTGPEVLWLGTRAPLQCWLPLSRRGQPIRDVEGPARESCASAAAAPAAAAAWLSPGAIAGLVAAAVLLAAATLALLAFRFRLHLTYVLHVIRANRALRSASKGAVANCDFDAFVCYSKYDRAWVVGELLPRLEGSVPRYRLCLHERDFPLGALVVQNIVECMERSRRTLIVLTPSFVQSQWCQWELEMATHRLLEGAGRDFLVLVELQRLEARALPRLLRLLVETRTFLQWPVAGGAVGCSAGSGEEAAWKRLRAALGPPMPRASSRRPLSPCPSSSLPSTSPPTEKPLRIKDDFAEREVERLRDKLWL